MREGLEYLELTHAPAVSHVCDCGAVWKLIVLGVPLECEELSNLNRIWKNGMGIAKNDVRGYCFVTI